MGSLGVGLGSLGGIESDICSRISVTRSRFGGMAATVRRAKGAEAALRGDVMHSDEATERIAFDRQRRCRQRLRKGPKPLRVGK